MYKVLLVDDETIVLDGLKRRIHWESLNLEIVGTATDGLDAIRKIEQLKPDIVITDIIMPIMDGIKLIETIRELELPVKIIILSGHDEFSYAQKAIRLGAIEYQLKPVSSEEIESSLKKTIEQLTLEKASYVKHSELEESSKQQALKIKQYMLTDLATGKADHWERLIYEVGKIDPQSLNGQFLVSIMSLDPKKSILKPISQKDAELTIFLALNIANEIIGSNNTNFAVKFDANRIVLFTFFPIDWTENQIRKSIHWMFSLVLENISQYLEYNATIGIGPVVQMIKEVHISYQLALDTLQCQLFFKPGTLIFNDQVQPRLQKDPARKARIPAELYQSIHDLDLDKTSTLLDQLLTDLVVDETTSYALLIQTCYKLILEASVIITPSSQEEGAQETTAKNEVQLLDKLRTISSIVDLKEWIIDYFNLIFSIARNETKKHGGMVSNHIIGMIESNYQSDINLTDLAAQLFMSANYLSTLFKKETGVSFKRYLNDYRLEKSKQLLKNPSLKIYQIANMVGYESEEHFSRLFKSIFGMTCTEYREQSV